jgi:hypothetical protein
VEGYSGCAVEVHDCQRNKIGRAGVQAHEDIVGGSSKGKYNTQKEPAKNEDIRRIRIILVNV